MRQAAATGAAGLSYSVNEWVADKQNDGELGGGLSGNPSGTSIFDPVLCELAYRWFCPQNGLVLDPFAGGSVRGIVASRLGRQYVGIDLRPEQIAANREQANTICGDPMPVWHEGDSRNLARIADGVEADLVFSCPPYADLERYSDNPRDLSTMEYADFLAAYREIIAASIALLKPDRFACFVVGDARDSKGFYYGLPWHTVQAFEDAGARLYNEAVLVTAVGSLPIRVAKQFESSRKLGKTHQNCLVFCKGDPRRATAAIGAVEFGNIEAKSEEFGEPL
jgi:DNA modification methylase